MSKTKELKKRCGVCQVRVVITIFGSWLLFVLSATLKSTRVCFPQRWGVGRQRPNKASPESGHTLSSDGLFWTAREGGYTLSPHANSFHKRRVTSPVSTSQPLHPPPFRARSRHVRRRRHTQGGAAAQHRAHGGRGRRRCDVLFERAGACDHHRATDRTRRGSARLGLAGFVCRASATGV